MLITNQRALNELCSVLESEDVVAFDTEFVRRDTYYPILSLIQVATKTYTKLIDPIGLDLEALRNILFNKKIVKIFHAPKQDFEIFYRVFGELPTNIFDTQIAAGFCGLRSVMSYADLCLEVCCVTIDKTYQAANWLARPIREEMIDYAIKDVEYLHDLYEYLRPRIDDAEKYQTRVEVELADPRLYQLSPENAWKKVKSNHGSRSEEFIEKLKVLAAFREEVAARIDVPRGHFIPDSALIQICNVLPRSRKAFKVIKWHTRWMKTDEYRDQIIDLCTNLA